MSRLTLQIICSFLGIILFPLSIWSDELNKFNICSNLAVNEKLQLSNLFNDIRKYTNQTSGEIHYYPINYIDDLDKLDLNKADILTVQKSNKDFKSILNNINRMDDYDNPTKDAFLLAIKLQLFNSVECQLCSHDIDDEQTTLVCHFAFIKPSRFEKVLIDNTAEKASTNCTESVYDSTDVAIQTKPEERPVSKQVAKVQEYSKIDDPDISTYSIGTVISKRTTFYDNTIAENNLTAIETETKNLISPQHLLGQMEEEQMRLKKNLSEDYFFYNGTNMDPYEINSTLADGETFNSVQAEKEKKMMDVVKVVASISSVGAALLMICCAYCMCCKGDDDSNQQTSQAQQTQ